MHGMIADVQIGAEWFERQDKDVESKVKLLPTNQQWILNVSTDDICILQALDVRSAIMH
jgi:hypothetical protein